MPAFTPTTNDLPSPVPRRERAFARVLLALLCAGLSTFGLLYCVQPLLPVFACDFRLDAETASLAVSAATAALALGLLFASALSDRWGRKPVITGAPYAAALLTMLAGAAPSWPLAARRNRHSRSRAMLTLETSLPSTR